MLDQVVHHQYFLQLHPLEVEQETFIQEQDVQVVQVVEEEAIMEQVVQAIHHQ